MDCSSSIELSGVTGTSFQVKIQGHLWSEMQKAASMASMLVLFVLPNCAIFGLCIGTACAASTVWCKYD